MSKLLREYDEVIEAVMAQAKSTGHYAVMRLHRKDFYNVVFKNGAIDKLSIDGDVGTGIYVFTKSGHVAFGSSNDLSRESVLALAADLAKIADANEAAGLATAEQVYELGPQENLGQDKLHYQTYDVAQLDPALIATNLGKFEGFAKSIDPGASTLLQFHADIDTWRVVRSDGTDVDWCVPKSRMYLTLTIKSKSGTASGRIRLIDNSPELMFGSIEQHKKDVGELVEQMRSQLGAPSIAAGHYPILVDADLGGMVAHEALGHPAESDLVASGGSALGNEQKKFIAGTMVAAKDVTIEDHEDELAHGFHPYGAFGNARQPVTIIKDGVLSESISDVFTASKTGVTNKNCERSEGYYAPAIPRMSNTFVNMTKLQELANPDQKDLLDPETLQVELKNDGFFAKHPKVVLLRQMTGGAVSTATGDFMFGTGFVYELSEQGVTAYKPVSFSGNVVEALKSLEFGLGKVQKNVAGFCGKSEQVAHVNTGGNQLMFFAPTNQVSIA
ncbi:TldD/PmbA family protein [Candidatus Saccharibacteria bacterium]|nr:TldD/PmbA family protein [Candidatus Saccharibacteria bacterium]